MSFGQRSNLINPITVLSWLDLEEGMKVGDLGCGRGQFAFPAAAAVGTQGMVHAIDILPSVLNIVEAERVSRGWDHLQAIHGNLEIEDGAGLPNASLDRAMLINVLWQTGDKRAVFRETRRLLHDDGRLVAVDWKKDDLSFGPNRSKCLAPDDVANLAESQGLSLRDQFNAGPHHWGLVFLCSKI